MFLKQFVKAWKCDNKMFHRLKLKIAWLSNMYSMLNIVFAVKIKLII